MKYLLIICFIPILAFAQVNPIDPNHTLVNEAFGRLAEIKPDIEYKIPFSKKAAYSQILFHRTAYDTAAEYELFFTLKKKTTTPVPVIVEQIVDAEQATFSSNWGYHGTTNATGWLNNTISFSNTPGSTISYSFTGRKIELYGETLPNHGTGTVKIDNEPEVTVSFKSPTKVLPAKIFEKSWPTDGPHTITVKVVSGYVLADFFKVFKVQ